VLVLLNTADQPVLVAGLASGFTPGAELRALHAEQPPAVTPRVGPGGLVQAVLPARCALVLAPTGAVVPPPDPPIAISVTTPVEGQTFTGDVTVQGTVSGPQAASVTRVRLVVDDYVNAAVNVPVAGDGSFSVVLPVSEYPVGVSRHSLAFFHPETQVASGRARFTTDVAFVGTIVSVDDPQGDDTGPTGAYLYPTDPTFGRQMDVVGLTAEVGVTTLSLKVKMAEWSTVWNPSLGFDHVCFNLFFELPGSAGVSFLPKLDATAPPGFAWSLDQFTYGWSNAMYRSAGATETSYGASTAAPQVSVDEPNRTVIFKYSRTAYGLASWSGVRVYLTTWDFDGIQAIFRPLDAAPGPFTLGGGSTGCTGVPPASCTDPKIMDEVGPITLP
jgi:hypothetical protein